MAANSAKEQPNTEPRRAEPYPKEPLAVIRNSNITEQGAQTTERTENARAMSAAKDQTDLGNNRDHAEVPADASNDKTPVTAPSTKSPQDETK